MSAVPKEEEVARLMRRLQEELGEEGFVFVSNWDDEADAFGVAHPRSRARLAYVCSYPDGFFVSLEIVEDGSEDSPETDCFHDLSDAEVVAVIQKHLGVE